VLLIFNAATLSSSDSAQWSWPGRNWRYFIFWYRWIVWSCHWSPIYGKKRRPTCQLDCYSSLSLLTIDIYSSSLPKIKLSQERLVNPAPHHQDYRVGLICGDIDWKLSIEGCFRIFMQVELSVEWNEVNCSFKACDWSIYPNIALVTFINDIFEEHSNILANKGVAASVKVYLV
jgi:hypothetical protein